MNKRFLSAAVLVAMVGLQGSAMATLTNSMTKTDYKTANSTVSYYGALITAAANDTTAAADSDVIVNLDGSISDICATVKATNQTGTNPTLELDFLGAGAAAGPYHVLLTAQDDDDPGTMSEADSGTLDIATASTTNVSKGICTSNFGIKHLPAFVKVRVTVGGTGTPGWTGVAYATVFRDNVRAMVDNVLKYVHSTVDGFRQQIAA